MLYSQLQKIFVFVHCILVFKLWTKLRFFCNLASLRCLLMSVECAIILLVTFYKKVTFLQKNALTDINEHYVCYNLLTLL